MDFITALHKLNFSENTAKILDVLKDGKYKSASEISTIANIPRTKVYVNLKDLLLEKYITETEDNPKKYCITNLQNLQEELSEIQKTIFKETSQLVPQSQVQVIQGREGIINWLQNEMVNLRKYDYSCTVLDRDFPDVVWRRFKRITNKGVTFKFLTYYNKEYEWLYKKWNAAGVEVRFFDPTKEIKILPRFSVMDNNRYRLTIGNPDVPSEDMYISFAGNDKTTIEKLKKYFLLLWKNAKKKPK